jgi:hypothetical protein
VKEGRTRTFEGRKEGRRKRRKEGRKKKRKEGRKKG